MSVPATKKLWQGLAISFAIAFAYATVLVKLFRDWWNDENYSHGLLIPFIIGYILWTQRDKLARVTVNPSLLCGRRRDPVCFVCTLGGRRRRRALHAATFADPASCRNHGLFLGLQAAATSARPAGLLFLAMPIPAIVFNKIAFPLQLFASRCAVWSMSMLGIPVLRQGNIIELKPLNSFDTKKLEVVEACSGIRSLMTLADPGGRVCLFHALALR